MLLAYRLPREPSTPRINVWRKLRRLGVVQLVDGLVALPATERSIEQLEWIAEEVVDGEGEAWTWIATPGSREQGRTLVDRISTAVAREYQTLADEAVACVEGSDRRTALRLRRELRRIEARDYFAPAERDLARRAVERLGGMSAEVRTEVRR